MSDLGYYYRVEFIEGKTEKEKTFKGDDCSLEELRAEAIKYFIEKSNFSTISLVNHKTNADWVILGADDDFDLEMQEWEAEVFQKIRRKNQPCTEVNQTKEPTVNDKYEDLIKQANRAIISDGGETYNDYETDLSFYYSRYIEKLIMMEEEFDKIFTNLIDVPEEDKKPLMNYINEKRNWLRS